METKGRRRGDPLSALQELRERLRDAAQTDLSRALADEAKTVAILRQADDEVSEAREAFDRAAQRGDIGKIAMLQRHERFVRRRRDELESALRRRDDVMSRREEARDEVKRRRRALGDAQVKLEVVARAIARADDEELRAWRRRAELELEEISAARSH